MDLIEITSNLGSGYLILGGLVLYCLFYYQLKD